MDDYLKTLPRKRMACGVLIFNEKNELLIVKNSYKDYWSIPGGVIEENESPQTRWGKRSQRRNRIRL